MAVLLVTEMKADAFLLHQATDKGIAAFLILHAVLPHPVAFREPVFHIDLVLAEQGFNNLRDGLLLENALIFIAHHGP